jgi:hypothetical protein
MSIVSHYKENNEKQGLAKSYSKMMKSIGEDLKNVGPHSIRQH